MTLNGTFEAGVAGWTAYGTDDNGPVTVSRSSTWASEGTYSMKLENGTGGGFGIDECVLSDPFPVTVGAEYTLTFTTTWLSAGGPEYSGIYHCGFAWYDADEVEISSGDIPGGAGAMVQGATVSGTVIAPAGAVTGAVFLEALDAPGDTFFDALSVQGPMPTLFLSQSLARVRFNPRPAAGGQ